MKHSKQALCLMNRADFFSRVYNREEFLEVGFGTTKNYGFLRQWAVGVAKNSYRRTRSSWSDYELRTHYDETAQELILEAIEFLEGKEFDTHGHAYNAIQKHVSNKSYAIITRTNSPVTFADNQAQRAEATGHKVEKYRDASGKLQYRAAKDKDGRWIKDETRQYDWGTRDPKQYLVELLLFSTTITPEATAEHNLRYGEQTTEDISAALSELGWDEYLNENELSVLCQAFAYPSDKEIQSQSDLRKAINQEWMRRGKSDGAAYTSTNRLISKITNQFNVTGAKSNETEDQNPTDARDTCDGYSPTEG